MTIDELENEALLTLHLARKAAPVEAERLRRRAAMLIRLASTQGGTGGIILGNQPPMVRAIAATHGDYRF